MAREWQPDDVAILSTGRREYIAIRTSYVNGEYVEKGAWHGGAAGRILAPDLTARPLVVIDPESADDAERLVRLFWANGTDDCDDMAAMRAALREFANPKPPKPDEPQGLGAVVRDVEGIRWTRVEAGHAKTRNPWHPADAADFQPDEWNNLCAVEILSEGVTP